MKKEDKAIIIEKLGEQLKEYAHFYLVDVTGMNAEATSALRRKAFGAGVKMVVVKNTLQYSSARLLTFLLSFSKKLARMAFLV